MKRPNLSWIDWDLARFMVVWGIVIFVVSLFYGCATGPQLTQEQQFPNAQCRYEATIATAGRSCTSRSEFDCVLQGMDRYTVWVNIYNQCDRLKPVDQFKK